ncbi:MAG: transcriptional regulator [Spirochaetaceae bacterium]
MDDLYTRFDAVFFEKTRLSVMTLLYRDEKAAFNTLKRRLDLTDGSLYTHLQKLIDAGYVAKSREMVGTGVQTVYRLTDTGHSEFREYLAFLEEMIVRSRNPGGNE